MDWIVEVIQKWESGTQMAFFLSCFSITAFVVLCLGVGILRTVRILFRGYTPVEAKPIKPQDCYSDDNLRGVCLKPGGCKTQAECDQMMCEGS